MQQPEAPRSQDTGLCIVGAYDSIDAVHAYLLSHPSPSILRFPLARRHCASVQVTMLEEDVREILQSAGASGINVCRLMDEDPRDEVAVCCAAMKLLQDRQMLRTFDESIHPACCDESRGGRCCRQRAVATIFVSSCVRNGIMPDGRTRARWGLNSSDASQPPAT